jgi:uncharacterized protein (TIGR00251 family)
MVKVDSVTGGAVLLVKVVPGSSREKIVGPLGERLKVAVRKPPEKGAANKAVCALLAEALGLRAGDVEILRGAGRPEKELLVRGLTPDEVRRRLGLS